MKKKVYIPIIIGAGAAAGIILGAVNLNSHHDRNNSGDTVISQETTTAKPTETTLSEEEKKKLEEQKQKEYEEKEKQEEQNASDKLKKKDEEKKKKKEEAQKKEEEEKKKAEEEKKKKEESENNTDDTENDGLTDTPDAENNNNAGYEYIYVPVDNRPEVPEQDNSYSDSGNPAPPATQHEHTWEAVYRTVHHNASTHNEKQKVGTSECTECYYYDSLYFTLTTEYADSYFYQACILSNGDLVYETSYENEKKNIQYFMSMMRISPEDEAFTFYTDIDEVTDDVTVTDREAYDERVFDHYICTGCGQTG